MECLIEWNSEWAEARSASQLENEGNLCPRRGCNTRPRRNRMTQQVRLDTPALGKRMMTGLPAEHGILAGKGRPSGLGAWCTK